MQSFCAEIAIQFNLRWLYPGLHASWRDDDDDRGDARSCPRDRAQGFINASDATDFDMT